MEERLRILKMVEEGKISAEEAHRLLSVFTSASLSQCPEQGRRKFRWFRIRVVDKEETLNIRIPWALIKWAIHFAPAKAQAKLKDMDIDLRELIRTVEENHFETGEILALDSTDGTQVKIWVE